MLNPLEGPRQTGMTRLTRYLYIFLGGFILGLFMSNCAYSQALTPAEANELSMDHCLADADEVDWEEGNSAIIAIICEMAYALERQAYILDNCRDRTTGQHKHCNAFDFYFSYEGLHTSCEVWAAFADRREFIVTHLGDFGWAGQTGFGLYVTTSTSARGSKLSFHLDLRGRYARWAFVDGEQVTYVEGLTALLERIERECE